MTIHVQHEQPQTRAARANWLPAPYGPFYVVLTNLLRCPSALPSGGGSAWRIAAAAPDRPRRLIFAARSSRKTVERSPLMARRCQFLELCHQV